MIGAIVAIVPFVIGSACLSGPALARRRLGKYLSIYLSIYFTCERARGRETLSDNSDNSDNRVALPDPAETARIAHARDKYGERTAAPAGGSSPLSQRIARVRVNYRLGREVRDASRARAGAR